MYDAGVSIISNYEMRELKRYKRFWFAGWAVAAVAILVAIATGFSLVALKIDRIALEQLQLEQFKEQRRMEALLQSQTVTAKLLASWGQLVMDRAELAGINTQGETVRTGVAKK